MIVISILLHYYALLLSNGVHVKLNKSSSLGSSLKITCLVVGYSWGIAPLGFKLWSCLSEIVWSIFEWLL